MPTIKKRLVYFAIAFLCGFYPLSAAEIKGEGQPVGGAGAGYARPTLDEVNAFLDQSREPCSELADTLEDFSSPESSFLSSQSQGAGQCAALDAQADALGDNVYTLEAAYRALANSASSDYGVCLVGCDLCLVNCGSCVSNCNTQLNSDLIPVYAAEQKYVDAVAKANGVIAQALTCLSAPSPAQTDPIIRATPKLRLPRPCGDFQKRLGLPSGPEFGAPELRGLDSVDEQMKQLFGPTEGKVTETGTVAGGPCIRTVSTTSDGKGKESSYWIDCDGVRHEGNPPMLAPRGDMEKYDDPGLTRLDSDSMSPKLLKSAEDVAKEQAWMESHQFTTDKMIKILKGKPSLTETETSYLDYLKGVKDGIRNKSLELAGVIKEKIADFQEKNTPALLRSSRNQPIHAMDVLALQKAPPDELVTPGAKLNLPVDTDDLTYRGALKKALSEDRKMLAKISEWEIPDGTGRVILNVGGIVANINKLKEHIETWADDVNTPKIKEEIEGVADQLRLMGKANAIKDAAEKTIVQAKVAEAIIQLLEGKPEKFKQQVVEALVSTPDAVLDKLPWVKAVADVGWGVVQKGVDIFAGKTNDQRVARCLSDPAFNGAGGFVKAGCGEKTAQQKEIAETVEKNDSFLKASASIVVDKAEKNINTGIDIGKKAVSEVMGSDNKGKPKKE